LLKINYVGYTDTILNLGSVDSSTQLNLPPIVLKENSVNLKEVAVTAMKNPSNLKTETLQLI
jgi:hypothetical protein